MEIAHYHALFEEIKTLTIRCGLASHEEFKGAPLSVIEDTFKNEGFMPDNCLLAYLLHFGGNISRNIDMNISIDSIENCQKVAKERSIDKHILSADIIIREQYPHLNQIKPVFLEHYEAGSVFIFTILNIENAVLFYYWGGDDITSENQNLTTTLRSAVFWAIINSLMHEDILIDGIGWVDFYKSLFKIFFPPIRFRDTIITWRGKYSLMAMKKEYEENRLLSVDEFENGFVQFIRDAVM